jgi:hypothetical protein
MLHVKFTEPSDSLQGIDLWLRVGGGFYGGKEVRVRVPLG